MEEDYNVIDIVTHLPFVVMLRNDSFLQTSPRGFLLANRIQNWLESNIGRREDMQWAWRINVARPTVTYAGDALFACEIELRFASNDDACLFKLMWC